MRTCRNVVILLLSGLWLAACGTGSSSSQGCTTTTQTDANDNPISVVQCGN